MPLIAGPGAISTVMVLVGQARDGGHRAALAIAIAANIVLTLVSLLSAPAIVRRIGETGRRIVSKIMGFDDRRDRRPVLLERCGKRRPVDPQGFPTLKSVSSLHLSFELGSARKRTGDVKP
jgi:hypothetical protein